MKGDYARALELGRRYYARKPRDTETLDLLAGICQQMGDQAGLVKYGWLSYQVHPARKHVQILLDAMLGLRRFDLILELARAELRLNVWRGWLTEPMRMLRLVRVVRRARGELTWQRRREDQRRRFLERNAPFEAARKAETNPPPAQDALAGPHVDPPPWPVGVAPQLPIELAIDPGAFVEELRTLDEKSPRDSTPCLELPVSYVRHEQLSEVFHEQFQPVNVRIEFRDVRESLGEYLAVGLWFETTTAEHREGLIEPWFSLTSGAVVRVPEPALAEAHVSEGSEFKPLKSTDLIGAVMAVARSAQQAVVDEELRPRLSSSRAALDASFARLQTQHREEWEDFAAQALAAGERRKHLNQELQRRRLAFQQVADELASQHRVHAVLKPIDLRRVRMPIMLANVQITRRQAVRKLLVPFNPLIRKFEPLPCSRCGKNGYVIGASDAGDLLCGACLKH
ncbi:MAG TPA: hypothetical protein VNT79_09060 [Phycisphaerae bacterium]|nr:hypothetical protein [Phycisphaerae bacterium]